MATVRILLLDDHARLESSNLKRMIQRAITSLRPGASIAWSEEDDLVAAIEQLEDLSQHFDLLLIDAHWENAFATSDEDSNGDLTDSLLEACRLRSNSVVVLISRNGSTLLKHIYRNEDRLKRPDAVLLKSHSQIESGVLRNVLAAAFSSARVPLRSNGKTISWVEASGIGQGLPSASARTAVAEIVCIVLENVDEINIEPISGGFSDTLTFVVSATRTFADGRQMPVSVMLKVARESEVLAAELRAHQSLTVHFPSATFAAPRSQAVLAFGGWSALAFDRVDGETAASARHRVIEVGNWGRIFSLDLIESAVAGSQIDRVTSAYAIAFDPDNGLLSGTRLPRALSEIQNLGIDLGSFAERKLQVSRLFETTQRLTPTVVGHGDFHPRNVMLRRDGSVLFVDAASVSASLPWCADLARFSVWLACEEIQSLTISGQVSGSVPQLLGNTLGMSYGKGLPGPFMDNLGNRIAETLRMYKDAFNNSRNIAGRMPVTVDVDSDWKCLVRIELLRVCYSLQMFDPLTRRTAGLLALRA